MLDPWSGKLLIFTDIWVASQDSRWLNSVLHTFKPAGLEFLSLSIT